MFVKIDGKTISCDRVQFPKFSKDVCSNTIAIQLPINPTSVELADSLEQGKHYDILVGYDYTGRRLWPSEYLAVDILASFEMVELPDATCQIPDTTKKYNVKYMKLIFVLDPTSKDSFIVRKAELSDQDREKQK